MTWSMYLTVFRHLLAADLKVLFEILRDKLINQAIYMAIVVMVVGYIMPQFGLPNDYGSFQLAGMVGSVALFDVFPNVMNLVSDFNGDRIISYHLSLPLPSWLVWLKTVCFYAITSIILGLWVLPIGKLTLLSSFDMTRISPIQFVVILVVIGFFFGAFSIFVASFVKDMERVDHVWARFVFPLWFLGGFQFSWAVLHRVSVPLSYIGLLDPVTYVMEGTRAAILGQEGYLNFWLCSGILILFTLVCFWSALTRLKKRLDYV